MQIIKCVIGELPAGRQQKEKKQCIDIGNHYTPGARRWILLDSRKDIVEGRTRQPKIQNGFRCAFLTILCEHRKCLAKPVQILTAGFAEFQMIVDLAAFLLAENSIEVFGKTS